MLSTQLSMHRASPRQTPVTVLACAGRPRDGQCGGIKGFEWINLNFVSLYPGGGCGT